MSPTTVGLDLSLSCTGLVALTGSKLDEGLRVKTPSSMELEQRIEVVRKEVLAFVRRHEPAWIVIEGPARGGKFVDVRVYHLAGVIRWYLSVSKRTRHIPRRIVTPTELKLEATGNGRASKKDMVAAARVFWPACPDDNAADAFHLAAWGQLNYGLFFD